MDPQAEGAVTAAAAAALVQTVDNGSGMRDTVDVRTLVEAVDSGKTAVFVAALVGEETQPMKHEAISRHKGSQDRTSGRKEEGTPAGLEVEVADKGWQPMLAGSSLY